MLDTTAAVATFGNILVVKWPGILVSRLKSEKLVKNNLKRIWDDRVLNHAYRIFGGIPDIDLVNIQNTVPEKIITRLHEMVQANGIQEPNS